MEGKGKSDEVTETNPSGNEETNMVLGELEEVVLKKAGVSTSSDAPPASASTSKSTSAKTLLASSTTTPGAFAIDNPLGAEENGRTQPSVADSQSLTANSSSAGGAAATSLTTAEPVSIALADPVNNETEDETNKSEGTDSNVGGKNQNSATRILVFLCLVLVIVVIAFAVSFSRPQERDPLLDRSEAMIEFLSRITPSDAFEGESKYNADRNNALWWITRDDPMQLPVPASDVPNSDPDASKLLERYVLAVLFFATNGEQWTRDYLFLTEYDVCLWSSARLDGDYWNNQEIEVRGITCDADGRVNTVRLYWNNLSGSLPDELTLFSDTVTQFLVGGGNMAGTIPTFFEQFTSLTNFAINDHCLTGTIPQGLTKLPLNPYVALYNNANELSGDLEVLCDSNSTSPAYQEGVQGFFVDYSVDCSCCTRCRPDDLECDDPIWNVTWPAINVEDVTSRDSRGNQIQFEKDCVTPGLAEYIAERCPCTTEYEDENGVVRGQCDDCTAPDARPSSGN